MVEPSRGVVGWVVENGGNYWYTSRPPQKFTENERKECTLSKKLSHGHLIQVKPMVGCAFLRGGSNFGTVCLVTEAQSQQILINM